MSPKQFTPALQLFETTPDRKTRAETILRLLISTSYPHAVIGNIGLMLVQGCQSESPEQAAEDLRNQERDLHIMDFIRTIEIRRSSKSIQLVAKRMVNLNSIKNIIDSAKTHEVYINLDIDVDNTTPLENTKALARYLLEIHYRIRVRGQQKVALNPQSKWDVESRLVDKDVSKQGLKGLKKTLHKTRSSTTDALQLLETSLAKPDFSISLTSAAINLRDQSKLIRYVEE